MKRLFLAAALLMGLQSAARADEGMWLPLLLKKYNFADMQAKGFRLSAEDIYSVNQASLKDAIVLFGGGCTGEMISPEGLLLTNHHCGFSQVQSHSSVENDYITKGFWAMDRKAELSNAGLTATFIVRMEDVTSQVLQGITPSMPEADREKQVQLNIEQARKNATQGTHYEASIKPYFYGQEYYMYVTETFRDVRLVGAPPLSIGNFGGDLDNWMWPRHTGDFSLFRIYASADNKPADYAPDNVPYKPKHYLPISLAGVDKGDFTMVFGFPGRTTEYLSSYGVAETYQDLNPARIQVRTEKLRILKEGMRSSDKIRIQYAAKYNSISNYHKKWTGENRGLKKLSAVEKKQAQEASFTAWATADPDRQLLYGKVLPQLKEQYEQRREVSLAREYVNEAAFGVELLGYANGFVSLLEYYDQPNRDQKELEKRIAALKNRTTGFYKDLNPPTDKALFVSLLPLYYQNVPRSLHPDAFGQLEKKYKSSWQRYADDVYGNSLLATEARANSLLNNFNEKNIKKLRLDPAYVLAKSIVETYRTRILPLYNTSSDQINLLSRTYLAGLREMQPNRKFYPDANSTLRVSYGKVNDYEPMDGARYEYYTTLDGVMEKAATGLEDYKVSDKLVSLYQQKDFGRYGENGTVPIAFIATNHTTGGNSGSPVIDANGYLIGTNFDRNWEGTMSDIMYDPDRVRNITIDVRYTLFVIDKFAGAGHLVREMKLVDRPEPKAMAPPADLEIDYSEEAHPTGAAALTPAPTPALKTSAPAATPAKATKAVSGTTKTSAKPAPAKSAKPAPKAKAKPGARKPSSAAAKSGTKNKKRK